jgi:hypothetical protein
MADDLQKEDRNVPTVSDDNAAFQGKVLRLVSRIWRVLSHFQQFLDNLCIIRHTK